LYLLSEKDLCNIEKPATVGTIVQTRITPVTIGSQYKAACNSRAHATAWLLQQQDTYNIEKPATAVTIVQKVRKSKAACNSMAPAKAGHLQQHS
jgi:hypothetical protein